MQTYISCSNCNKSFVIKPKQISKTGRNVCCNYCQHEWFASLDDVKFAGKTKKKALFSPLSPDFLDKYNQQEDKQDIQPDKVPHKKDTNQHHREWYHKSFVQTYQRWSWPITFTLLMIVSIVFFNIMSLEGGRIYHYPLLSQIYTKMGFIEPYTDTFILKDVHSEKAFDKGIPLLVIKGKIFNNTQEPIYPPLLKITLKDQYHEKLYQWYLKIKQELINPQEDYIFTSRLKSPPVGLKHITVAIETSHQL